MKNVLGMMKVCQNIVFLKSYWLNHYYTASFKSSNNGLFSFLTHEDQDEVSSHAIEAVYPFNSIVA